MKKKGIEPILRGSAWAIVLLTTGCANWSSVYRDFKPDEGTSVSIDAKQRVVYSITKDYGDGKAWRAVCAEPSPDALSALSATLGLDAGSAAKALGLAFSSQEGAASIGLRTQTIQTLRDAMYRLCEGYASGAIDDTGFTRLQRRYQAVMLGLLAIEQLTGTVVAQQATLGSSGSARLGQSLTAVSALVTEAQTRKATTAADLAARKKLADEKKTGAEAAKKALDDLPASEQGDKRKALVEGLSKALKEQADADEAQRKAAIAATAAEKDLESLEILRKELDRATALGSVTAALAPAQSASAADGATRQSIAQRVENIVRLVVEFDYTRETCLDTITSRSFQSAVNPLLSKTDDRDARVRLAANAQSLAALQLRFCAYAMEQSAIQRIAAQRAVTPGDLAAIQSTTTRMLQDLGLQGSSPLSQVPRSPQATPQPGQ